MNTLQINASIRKTGAITQHDKHLLCLAIIKQVMAMQLKETIYVPQVSHQGQGESQTSAGIASLECSNLFAQQKALV
jgi:hypothetical protein